MPAEQDDKFIIDTNPALQALYNEIGGSFRQVGQVLGVSHSHLWHALKGDREPVSVNTLVKYAQRTREHEGISMQLWITSEGKLKYKIERE
tara:strand:+ start:135 stop:407 length:273 start_codon:yes stop_codon:yes gene_type:complete